MELAGANAALPDRGRDGLAREGDRGGHTAGVAGLRREGVHEVHPALGGSLRQERGGRPWNQGFPAHVGDRVPWNFGECRNVPREQTKASG